MVGTMGETVHRHATLIAVVAALLATLLPFGLYVDELFVTFLHEASHGLAAILTGGSLRSFYLHADTSGMAMTSGGFRPLILVAGYMGGCLWGGALLVAARRRGLEKAVCWALCAFLLGFTLLYIRNAFGFATGLGMAGFFGAVAARGHGWQLALLLNFLAMRSILNSLEDVKTLTFYATRTGHVPVTDASLMSAEYSAGLVPPLVFALGIGAASVCALGAFLYAAWRVERKTAVEEAF